MMGDIVCSRHDRFHRNGDCRVSYSRWPGCLGAPKAMGIPQALDSSGDVMTAKEQLPKSPKKEPERRHQFVEAAGNPERCCCGAPRYSKVHQERSCK